MQRKIIYDDRPLPISDPARLDEDGTIYVNEPYLAFLWCLCYTVLTLYREREQALINSTQANRAVAVFNYALSLYYSWTSWDLTLPNPQEFDADVDPNVGEANGLFLYAGCLILCHEFSHQQLGHSSELTISQSKEAIENEFAADKAAVEIFITAARNNEPERIESIRLGALMGMGSILFPSECWDGAPTHPDADERLAKTIDMLTDDPGDDLWQFGMMVLMLWGIIHKKDFADPTGRASSRENYKTFAAHLKDQQVCA